MPAETKAQVIAIVKLKQTKARSGWNPARTLSARGVRRSVSYIAASPKKVRDERARRIAAARAHRKTIKQQRSNEAA